MNIILSIITKIIYKLVLNEIEGYIVKRDDDNVFKKLMIIIKNLYYY